MDNLTIVAADGMRTRMESLEMLANNLANVETGGFKADREFYSLFAGETAGDPVTADQERLPVVQSQWTDLSQGVFRNTSNPLDLAIDGDGFFAVRTKSGIRYTRDGSFRISSAGQLTTADGSQVASRSGGPITLQAGTNFEIAADGTVSQDGAPVGQIMLAGFAPQQLEKSGLNYFVPREGIAPGSATGTVQQGKLEGSNVNSAEGAVRLVAIMRQFEMLQKAMGIANDFSRQAIEEVAKVAA